jgi:hypothetical protein
LVGASPGTDEGNSDDRGAIGVTAGPGCVIGRDALGALFRGGSLVFANRRFGFACFFTARRLDATFFLRAGAARFFDIATFFLLLFLALRFFAMISPPSRQRGLAMAPA